MARSEYENRNPEHLSSSLLLPPTVESVLQSNPELTPVKATDFERVHAFFAQQSEYFHQQAETNTRPEAAAVYAEWETLLPGLEQRIRSNTRIITEPLFADALVTLHQRIDTIFKNEPYFVFLHGKDLNEAQHHSTFYVANRMQLNADRFITEAELHRDDVQEHLTRKGKLIVTDDGTYSSQNISEHIFDIQRVHPEFSESDLALFVVGSTKTARNRLTERGIAHQTVYDIPQLRDIFQQEDYRMLRFMHRPDHHGDSEQIPTYPEEVLTLLWQKVPDNFCHPLRKWNNKYWDGEQHHFWNGYLVDDSPTGIHPSYRQGKKFMFS